MAHAEAGSEGVKRPDSLYELERAPVVYTALSAVVGVRGKRRPLGAL